MSITLRITIRDGVLLSLFRSVWGVSRQTDPPERRGQRCVLYRPALPPHNREGLGASS